MIERYVSPAEFKRLISALMVVALFISILALFGFLVIPGSRNVNRPEAAQEVAAPQGETGWLDPTDYPAQARKVLPPIDPRTVMTPNPELMARGQALFNETCATCHGPKGLGDGPGGAGLKPPPRNFTQSAGWTHGYRIEDIYRTLEEGVKGTGMVSYAYLSRRDRMALVHVVQSMGAFDHGPEGPAALAALAKQFASAGEVIPNRIPVALAEHRLVAEDRAPSPLPAGIHPAVLDPGRAARTLAGIPHWREDSGALARAIVAGLPGNGFAPAVAEYGPAQWNDLRSTLAGRQGARE